VFQARTRSIRLLSHCQRQITESLNTNRNMDAPLQSEQPALELLEAVGACRIRRRAATRYPSPPIYRAASASG